MGSCGAFVFKGESPKIARSIVQSVEQKVAKAYTLRDMDDRGGAYDGATEPRPRQEPPGVGAKNLEVHWLQKTVAKKVGYPSSMVRSIFCNRWVVTQVHRYIL